MDAVNRLRALRIEWWKGLTPPTYYTFSPQTGELLERGVCDPSQLEPGVWLWPAHSVADAPSPTMPGSVCVWNGDTWRNQRDRRGEIVYAEGEFREIRAIGAHKALTLVIHDAQYVMAPNNDDAARIRMWVNDDIIEFEDDPALVARRALAEWEKLGEVIRPVEADIETIAERDAREAAAREAAIAEAEAIDAAAALVVEGPRIEETDL